MAEFSNELTAKLKKAQSLEEVTELLKADGQDEALAEKLWKEIGRLRESEDKTLSLDELEAVSGGVKKRDWLEDGCAATVEPNSDCWGTDGGCTLINIKYSHKPTCEEVCPQCGGYVTELGSGGTWVRVQCRKCGKFYQSFYNRKWVHEG